jgi:hypothetical protein
MILGAREALGLVLSYSVLVGDKDSTDKAGRGPRVKHSLWLRLDGEGALGRLEFPALAAIDYRPVNNFG